jgi:hypothetical protein
MLERTSLANDRYKTFIEREIQRQQESILGLRGQLRMAEQQLDWLEAELQEHS